MIKEQFEIFVFILEATQTIAILLLIVYLAKRRGFVDKRLKNVEEKFIEYLKMLDNRLAELSVNQFKKRKKKKYL